MFVTHYATTEPPKYRVQGGTLSPVESGLLVSPERGLRFGYDDASGAVNLQDPPLQIICGSIADPTRAPAGMHTMKVVGWQPYQLKEGPQHWDQIKNEVSDANLEFLRRFAPNLTDDKILARFIESPLDLERMNPHFWHGSAHAGAQSAALLAEHADAGHAEAPAESRPVRRRGRLSVGAAPPRWAFTTICL